eukprot:921552-Rhodomonas_salina.1
MGMSLSILPTLEAHTSERELTFCSHELGIRCTWGLPCCASACAHIIQNVTSAPSNLRFDVCLVGTSRLSRAISRRRMSNAVFSQLDSRPLTT